MQHLKQNASEGTNYYLIPQTTSADAGASFSYKLSERTNLTGTADYGQIRSAIDNAQSASAQLGIGRQFTQHWFTAFSGGGGHVFPLSGASTYAGATSRGTQWEASEKLGYRNHTNTWVVTGTRSISDLYGAGAAATLSLSAGWNWHMQGSAWSFQTGVENDRLSGQASVASLATNGIRVNAGVYRTLGRRAVVVLQYSYATLWGTEPPGFPNAGQPLRFDQQAIRLNIGFGAGGPAARTGTASNTTP